MLTGAFKLNVWSDSSKSVLRTPTAISRFYSVDITKKVSQPAQCTLVVPLSDYLLANIERGDYFELTRSRNPNNGSPPLWENGYIIDIQDDTSNPMSKTITTNDPLWFLSVYRTPGKFYAGPGTGFSSIIDLMEGSPAHSTQPGQMGLLPPSWSVNWVDGINSPATTGLTVGSGDIWEGGFDTAMTDVSDNCQHYNVFFRPNPTNHNTAESTKVDMGPLGDPSGLTIWGAAELLADLVANHGYPSSRARADLRTAQKYGYAVISNAKREADYSQIKNICWVIGKGNSENSLHNIAGGPPLDSTGAVANGWSLYTPSNNRMGRVYYTKSASNYATYDGQVFTFIATHMDNGGWMYGVVDTTSVASYGPCEYTAEDIKVKDARLLTDYGMGVVSTWGQPVVNFTFEVIHPLTNSDGTPTRVAPGQTVVVNYSGQIPSVEKGINGQWGPSGSGTYHYLDYPGTSDTHAIAKLKRCIQYDESWSNSGQFKQTITLGTSPTKWKAWNDALVRQLLKARHQHERNHSFTKVMIDGLPVLCTNTPQAYEDPTAHALKMNPGSIAVFDVPDASFFTDHHRWTFSVDLPDNASYIDCWFWKPVDTAETLTVSPGGTNRAYGCVRLARPGSATSSGIYTTVDGSTWVQRGKVYPSALLDANDCLIPEKVHVTFEWTGKRFQAIIAGKDSDTTDTSFVQALLATWADATSDASQILDPTNTGTIGWMLHAGASIGTITDVHAHPEYFRTIHRGSLHPGIPAAHHWHNMPFEPIAYNTSTKVVTIRPRVRDGVGGLMDSGNNYLKGEDGTLIKFTTAPPDILGQPENYLVYNGSAGSISGYGGTIAKNSFGCVTAVQWQKMSHDWVVEHGQISKSIDKHTHLPDLEPHKPAAGTKTKPTKGAHGRKGQNRHHPAKKKRRTSSLATGSGGGYNSIAKAS